MSLAVVIDHATRRLGAALGPGTKVGDAAAHKDSLPAVTLSVRDAVSRAAGVGRVPRGTRTGALEVTAEVDLANPVLDLGGGETLRLVPDDRRSLVLPHGPLVRADGTPDEPFTAGDLQVRDTSVYVVVAAPPTGRQVRPDADAGVLHFGQPLPASGSLRVTYRIGAWDVVVARYQGRLDARVTAGRDALTPLVRRVADALDADEPACRLVPVAWAGSTRPADGDLPPAAMQQDLGYLFDAEVETPLLGSGGGVIARVAVTLRQARSDDDSAPHAESFAVTGGGKNT